MQMSVFQSVRVCDTQFLLARDHLGQTREVCIATVVIGFVAVVGTSGCDRSSCAGSLHIVRPVFAGGFQPRPEMIIGRRPEVVAAGDPNQEPPHKQGELWESACCISSISLVAGALALPFQVVSELGLQGLVLGVHLDNAIGLGRPLGAFVVAFAHQFAQ